MDARTYRAAPAAYATSGAIALIATLLWGMAVWRLGAPWPPLLVPLVAFGASVVWLSRFRLTFTGGEFALAAPFRPGRRLALRDVLSIELGTESDRGASPFVLCIRTSGGEELRFDARMFAPDAVRRLIALSPAGQRDQARSSKRPR